MISPLPQATAVGLPTARPAQGTGASSRLIVDPTLTFRRRAGALALPLAMLAQVITNTLYAVISTRTGLTDTATSAETLQLYGRYPGTTEAAATIGLIGVALLAPGLLAALRLLRPTRPRLALVAVIMMLAGYLAYLGVLAALLGNIALATTDPTAGDVLDAQQALTTSTAMFGVFVIGNLVGTLLLGLAVLLSRGQAPRVAGILIMAWPVGHIIGLSVGNEWVEVTAGILEVIGLSIVAARALALTDSEWIARG